MVPPAGVRQRSRWRIVHLSHPWYNERSLAGRGHNRGCHVEKRGLSFVDGFQFGCGFVAAMVSFWVALSIALAIVGVILSLLGFPDLGAILRRMGVW